MSARGRLSDGGWLSAVLARGGSWAHGPIEIVRVDRIGLGFGLSGETWRLHATTAGGSATLVAKIEDAERTARALTAHRHVGPALGAAMPTCIGSWNDGHEGLLLLEDIDPAVQGDELRPCPPASADAVIRTVAALHDRTVESDQLGADVERWQPPVRAPGWWPERLAGIAARYPALLADGGRDLIERLLSPVVATAQPPDPPCSWIHVDPHLDNVLWRSDGSAVLLDWSNARIGPPAVDVAVLLVSLAFCDTPSRRAAELLDRYVALTGRRPDRRRLAADVAAALAIHLIGVIGWAGAPANPVAHPRSLALRDDAVRRVRRALEWIDAVRVP